MTERKTSLWTKILIISIGILVLMSIFSNALIIGERFREKSIYLEFAYYGLILFIIIFGVVYPIFGVFAAPIFSLEKLHTADGTAKKKWCKKLTNNLLKNVDLTPEEKEQVLGFQKIDNNTDDQLIEFFDRKIRPQINAEMMSSAKQVMIITAVSQNSVYDMLGMAAANFSMVKRIVEICGFRPTTPQVLRLYLRILSYTFLSGVIEDMNVEEYVPMIMEGSLGKLSQLAIASVTEGLVNALTTLRIASITKNYLLNADVNQTRKDLRKKSYKEASLALKDLAGQFVEDKFKNPIKNAFSKFGTNAQASE